MEVWLIGLIVVLVLVAAWYFLIHNKDKKKDGYYHRGAWYYYDKDKKKDGYHGGAGYGWSEKNWLYGASGQNPPSGCSATIHHACDVSCQDYPRGMSHADCVNQCMTEADHVGPGGANLSCDHC